jgi:hypothetical protein
VSAPRKRATMVITSGAARAASLRIESLLRVKAARR